VVVDRLTEANSETSDMKRFDAFGVGVLGGLKEVGVSLDLERLFAQLD
jgi:hypothetical protein